MPKAMKRWKKGRMHTAKPPLEPPYGSIQKARTAAMQKAAKYRRYGESPSYALELGWDEVVQQHWQKTGERPNWLEESETEAPNLAPMAGYLKPEKGRK